jgi:hypothetical protein
VSRCRPLLNGVPAAISVTNAAISAYAAGFTDRGLKDTELRRGQSATGDVYLPKGTFRSLEVILVQDDTVVRELVPVEPAL